MSRWQRLVYRIACRLAGHLPEDLFEPVGVGEYDIPEYELFRGCILCGARLPESEE